MTRTYIAKRLLEHGPLTAREFHAITGWTARQAHKTIEWMLRNGQIKFWYESEKSPRRYRLC